MDTETDEWTPSPHGVLLKHNQISVQTEAEAEILESGQKDRLRVNDFYSEAADGEDEAALTQALGSRTRVVMSCANCFSHVAYDPSWCETKHVWVVTHMLTGTLRFVRVSQGLNSPPTSKRRQNNDLMDISSQEAPSQAHCAECNEKLGTSGALGACCLYPDAVILENRSN